MIRLTGVTEENWIDIAHLSVNDEQQAFIDCPMGIIARGYIYRHCNARVIGIANDRQMIGIALVRDLDEDPACVLF